MKRGLGWMGLFVLLTTAGGPARAEAWQALVLPTSVDLVGAVTPAGVASQLVLQLRDRGHHARMLDDLASNAGAQDGAAVEAFTHAVTVTLAAHAEGTLVTLALYRLPGGILKSRAERSLAGNTAYPDVAAALPALIDELSKTLPFPRPPAPGVVPVANLAAAWPAAPVAAAVATSQDLTATVPAERRTWIQLGPSAAMLLAFDDALQPRLFGGDGNRMALQDLQEVSWAAGTEEPKLAVKWRDPLLTSGSGGLEMKSTGGNLACGAASTSLPARVVVPARGGVRLERVTFHRRPVLMAEDAGKNLFFIDESTAANAQVRRFMLWTRVNHAWKAVAVEAGMAAEGWLHLFLPQGTLSASLEGGTVMWVSPQGGAALKPVRAHTARQRVYAADGPYAGTVPAGLCERLLLAMPP